MGSKKGEVREGYITGEIMRRGKQQILFNYLPGKTFDFERLSLIARIRQIKGPRKDDLNLNYILYNIMDYVSDWKEEYRPALVDNVFRKKPYPFILIDPRSVDAEMFPLILWCQNQECGMVFDFSSGDLPYKSTCPSCNKGKLIQMRWVKVHRCGSIQPLKPYCFKCKSSRNISLDTRGSERISSFRWICRSCKSAFAVYGGVCKDCSCNYEVPGDPNVRHMDVEVYRSGRTFYPHYVTLINQPMRDIDAFISLPEWPELAAALFLKIPELNGKNISDFTNLNKDVETGSRELTQDEIDELKNMGQSEAQINAFLEMQRLLKKSKQNKQREVSPDRISNLIIRKTGINHEKWLKIGRELLDSVTLLQQTKRSRKNYIGPMITALGFAEISLITDFPISICTFGYSRIGYKPNTCRLNPFPHDKDHGNKLPIYIDLIQADSIVLRLDPSKVLNWLKLNGYGNNLNTDKDEKIDNLSYFVNLFDGVSFCENIHSDLPEARMVFGLLHTLCHLCIRQAALLCGLERTSLSEYMLPRTLTFALYCNHRAGATIGAFVSLFERSLEEWLSNVRNARNCVYDPVCADNGGNCHACTHLAETSCRYFNQNLSRAFLFGGQDGDILIKKGYFDTNVM